MVAYGSASVEPPASYLDDGTRFHGPISQLGARISHLFFSERPLPGGLEPRRPDRTAAGVVWSRGVSWSKNNYGSIGGYT